MVRVGMILAAATLAIGMGLPAALAAGPATAPAAKAAPSPNNMKGAMGALVSQYSQMSYHVKITPEQKAKLKEENEAMVTELEALHEAEVKKSKDAIAAIEATTGAEREKLRQQLLQERAKADSNFMKLYASHEAAMNAILTPEQRVTWETYKLNRSVYAILRNAPELTDAQKKQVEPMVQEAAKELAEGKDGATPEHVNGTLIKKLMAEVLTDEQAGRLLLGGQPELTGLGTIPGPKKAPVDHDLP